LNDTPKFAVPACTSYETEPARALALNNAFNLLK